MRNHAATILKTKRLWLRPFKEKDFKAVREYASDPQVVRYLDWTPLTDSKITKSIRKAMGYSQEMPRLNYGFAITLMKQNRLIGGCGIHITKTNPKVAEIGYCLNRDFWGQGYATEAQKALLKFGFTHLKLNKIFALSDAKNKASARVLKKIGMRRQRLLRSHKKIKGRWRDSVLFVVKS